MKKMKMKNKDPQPFLNDPELTFNRYYNLSLRFLSYRPRSEQEVYKYLLEKAKKAKNLDEKIIASIMGRLVEYKFVDDFSFAKFWIEHRKKGFRILQFELQQKGVSKEILEKALAEFDLESKETDLINHLIERKTKSLQKYPEGKAREKMIAFLLRKGFDYNDVKKALEEAKK